MREMEDNQFDLAIVDIPYGLKIGGSGKIGGSNMVHPKEYKVSEWDNETPSGEYFAELQRVSKNQIIFGGNYVADILPTIKGWIIWDKKIKNDWDDNFSDGEMAWTSFKQPMKIYRFLWMGALKEKTIDNDSRIHITQKPIKLYKWLLKKYAKPNDTILDTHVGSGSSRIACWEMGFDFTGYEIDKDYWEAQEKRFAVVKNQINMFQKE